MNDVTVKVLASLVALALSSVVGWQITTIMSLEKQMMRGMQRVEHTEEDIADLEDRFGDMIERIIELHPMQRSGLADLYGAVGADCRDDFDCDVDELCDEGICIEH